MKLRSKLRMPLALRLKMESVVGFKPTNNRFAICLLRSLGYTDIVGTDEKTRTLTNSFGDYYATITSHP